MWTSITVSHGTGGCGRHRRYFKMASDSRSGALLELMIFQWQSLNRINNSKKQSRINVAVATCSFQSLSAINHFSGRFKCRCCFFRVRNTMELIAARETQTVGFTENSILHTAIFGSWSRSQGAFRSTSYMWRLDSLIFPTYSSFEGPSCRTDGILWLVSWMHTLPT